MRWGCLSRSRNSSYAGTTSAASTPRNRSGCSTPTHCDPAAPTRPAGMRRDISIGNPASLGAHVSRRNAFLSYVQYFAFPQEVRALEHKRPLSVATGRQLRRFVEIPGHEYMNSFRISTRVLSLSVSVLRSFCLFFVSLTPDIASVFLAFFCRSGRLHWQLH